MIIHTHIYTHIYIYTSHVISISYPYHIIISYIHIISISYHNIHHISIEYFRCTKNRFPPALGELSLRAPGSWAMKVHNRWQTCGTSDAMHARRHERNIRRKHMEKPPKNWNLMGFNGILWNFNGI